MVNDPLGVTFPSRAADRESCDRDHLHLDIEIDSRMGLIRVRDARLFHRAGRAYARRLIEGLCECPGVRKAEIDLASSTCVVDFDLVENSPAVMARVFIDSVCTASLSTGRPSWWKRSPRWVVLTAYRAGGGTSLWETIADQKGGVRLIHRGPVGDRAASSQLADRVASVEEVERCHVPLWSHRITVVVAFGGGPSASRTVDRVERILEGWKFAEPLEAEPTVGVAPTATDCETPIAVGWKRLAYVALAGGAFTMTLVGLIVPGIPTVPFLMATSYYLARSSPRMNERLRRTAFFGPILTEWQGHNALSLNSKGKLIGLTAAALLVTAVLMPLTAVALIVILFISSLSVYGVSRVSTLTRGAQAGGGGRIGVGRPRCRRVESVTDAAPPSR